MKEEYVKLKNGTWMRKVTKEDFEDVKKKRYYYRKAWLSDREPTISSYMNCLHESDSESSEVFHSYKDFTSKIQTQFTRAEYAAIAKEKGIPEGYHIEEEVTE